VRAAATQRINALGVPIDALIDNAGVVSADLQQAENQIPRAIRRALQPQIKLVYNINHVRQNRINEGDANG